jgi:hypothetical protein
MAVETELTPEQAWALHEAKLRAVAEMPRLLGHSSLVRPDVKLAQQHTQHQMLKQAHAEASRHQPQELVRPFLELSKNVLAAAMRTMRSMEGDALDLLLAPGDVFALSGSGQLSKIGTVRGFLGHVLLVAGVPRAIRRGTPEADELADAWPSDEVAELWRIPVAESTRSEKGLYCAELVVFVDQRRGNRLTLIGDINSNDEMSLCRHEEMRLWQSPHELRKGLRTDIVQQVLTEMKACQSNWSHATAVRAVVKSAKLKKKNNCEETLDQVAAAWEMRPICTSIIVIFWQRYLLKSANGQGPLAAELILRWMPLKADRTLPGDLESGLQAEGWVHMASIPRLQSSQR